MKKILIINMYKREKKYIRLKKKFKKIFKGYAKLHFCCWQNHNRIKKLLSEKKFNGIILSGSEYRVRDMNKRAIIPDEVFISKIPILGICYGFQYMISKLGKLEFIKSFKERAYHRYIKRFEINSPFFVDKSKYYFIHHDYVTRLPKNWKSDVTFKDIIYIAYNENAKHIGVQFHPELRKKSSRKFFPLWLKYIS